jgi:hypothetical protein
VRTATLTIEDVPPSLNTVATAHWRKYGRIKKAWQSNCEACLMVEQVPRRLQRVTATAVLRFPLSRRRDEGNFRFFLEKTLGDALVNGGWLADDTLAQYSFGAIAFADKGPKRTIIELEFE